MDFLIQFIARILTWLFQYLKWAAEWVFSEVLGALVTVLSAIPVPQFLSDAPSVLSSLPSGILWGMQAFQVPAGFVIFITALLLRFLIRRIPLIG